jgi:hypothetical protein
MTRFPPSSPRAIEPPMRRKGRRYCAWGVASLSRYVVSPDQSLTGSAKTVTSRPNFLYAFDWFRLSMTLSRAASILTNRAGQRPRLTEIRGACRRRHAERCACTPAWRGWLAVSSL